MPQAFHPLPDTAPIPPALSTVHGAMPELNVCDNTVAGDGVPVAVMIVASPLHIFASVVVKAGTSGG